MTRPWDETRSEPKRRRRASQDSDSAESLYEDNDIFRGKDSELVGKFELEIRSFRLGVLSIREITRSFIGNSFLLRPSLEWILDSHEGPIPSVHTIVDSRLNIHDTAHYYSQPQWKDTLLPSFLTCSSRTLPQSLFLVQA